MSKKIITACMALVAFAAFVLPATASAANDPQLTESGSLVATGTTLIATASNIRFTTTEGTTTLVTCSTAKMTGTLKTNSASTVKWEIAKGSASFQGTGAVNADNNLPECTGTFGNFYMTVPTALCVESTATMEPDEFQVNGCTGKIKFITGSTTAGACEYETTGAVKGTATTNTTPASLTTVDTSAGSGIKLIAGGFLCPSSGALAMTFTLETTNGTGLTLS